MELNYENNKINKLIINTLLKKGKKTNSEKIIKNLLIQLKKKTKKNPNKIIKFFINNIKIKIKAIEINKKKRNKQKKWKKKKSLYVFIFLNKNKQIKIPLKWLFSNKNNYTEIINEIINISKKENKIINEKKNYYKEIKKLKFFF